MMKKVRVGIIGIGEIGTTKHLTQLSRHKDEVEIAALCDLIPERCEKAKKDFDLDAKVYTDYKEICADESLDVIHVCTPNPLHCEMTILALNNGKDVYCEKPLACTWADAQKMLEVQKKTGKKLASGTQWRYNTATVEMKRMFEAGEFGMYTISVLLSSVREDFLHTEYIRTKN